METGESKVNKSADELVPQDLKERYIDFQMLGAGGMGCVISATDTRLAKRVAIKVLPRTLGNPKAVMRFQQEAKAASKLNHPGVVQVMDFGYASSGEPFLVMEHVTGENLEQIIDRIGPLPVARVIEIAIQVAAALEHAHGQGVIHRDLKPANIMIDEGNKSARILDFGLARITESEDHRLTAPGSSVGTLLYMSPEQLRGEDTDARTDIYALGLVILKLATGNVPYENEQVMKVVSGRLKDAPPALPLNDASSETEKALSEIVEHALAVDADERLESMSEFKEALIEIMPQPIVRKKLSQFSEARLNPVQTIKMIPVKWLIVAVSATAVILTMVAAYFLARKPMNSAEVEKQQQQIVRETLKITKAAVTSDTLPLGFNQRPVPLAYVIAEQNIGDEDLKKLLKCGVTRLSLETNRNITEEGMKTIAKLPLVGLSLRQTNLGDECADEINSLKKLESLDLRESEFTPQGVRKLRPSKFLKTISFKYMDNFSDGDLKYVVESFPNLDNVTISDTAVTARGIKLLRALPIRILALEDLPIDDSTIDDVIALKAVSLNLCGSKIADKSLEKLAKQKNLKDLQLEHCPNISKQGVAKLRQERPDILIKDTITAAPTQEMEELFLKSD